MIVGGGEKSKKKKFTQSKRTRKNNRAKKKAKGRKVMRQPKLKTKNLTQAMDEKQNNAN